MKYSSNQEIKEYVVEKVVDKKVREGKVFYLVKWEKNPEIEFSWERESKLDNLKELIKEYEDECGGRNSYDKSLSKNESNRKTFPPEGTLETDRPKEIRKMKIVNRSVYLKVKWFPRVSGVVPRHSLIQYDVMRNMYPLMVLDFFERQIILNDMSISDLVKENKINKD
jgi:hypothetical protein